MGGHLAHRDLTELLGPGWESHMIPKRCLPPLGVHEWCEHDPAHPEPTFRGLTDRRGGRR